MVVTEEEKYLFFHQFVTENIEKEQANNKLIVDILFHVL